MESRRKPYLGLLNIIQFNWHLYSMAILTILILSIGAFFLPHSLQRFGFIALILSLLAIFSSLIFSYYIYDVSNLYKLNWLNLQNNSSILNIHAGFDEWSDLISSQYPNSQIISCDFYNPTKQTERSIQNARKIYPPSEKNIKINTDSLPFNDNTFDYSLIIFSAHEIRSFDERLIFFKELNRVTKKSGSIIIVEHLRDLNNFLAFNLGFFHFYSKSNWFKSFQKANLILTKEQKITPFISIFTLKKHGDSF